jgi:hypothetical protein
MQKTDAELFYPGMSGPTGTVETSAPVAPPAGEQKTDAELFYPNDVPKPAPVQSVPTSGQSPDPALESAEPKPGEYQLDMPEGVTVDADLLTAATPVLRDLGLSDEQASKLVPLAQQVQDQFVSGMEAHHAELRSTWQSEAKADATIGGANWNESVRLAGNALNIGGAGPGSEVRKLLNETGLGDHPAFIRLFRNIGLKLGQGSGAKTDADLFYPGMGKGQ